MTPDWIAFLQSHGALIEDDRQIAFTVDDNQDDKIYPVTDLTIFSVRGVDAEAFLQGQLTCNVNEIDDEQASFAGYCTAKGRVISTLLVCKRDDEFLVILPSALIDKVIKKLRMYVLRSKVTIENLSEQCCLLGLRTDRKSLGDIALPDQPMAAASTQPLFIKLPGLNARYLAVAPLDQAKQLWTQAINAQAFTPGDSNAWVLQDLSAGIPWFSEAQSEQYIPQMLNIDKLGGISFNKGCYTGQEIVARTHYLGKAKRELFLAECAPNAAIDADSAIISGVSQESCGKILSYCRNNQVCRLLLVMPSGQDEQDDLAIDNSTRDPITIIPFQ